MSKLTDEKAFVSLVRSMRLAQKDYFKTRDKRAMQRAIILEKIVDDEIEERMKPKEIEPVQLSIFDD